MAESPKIVLGTKGSRLRWLVLLLIVGTALSVDHLLKSNISSKVSDAWLEACEGSTSTLTCTARIDSHHARCFDIAYSSMMLTFGRERWESFKLIDYEACMNRDEPGEPDKIEI